MSREKNDFIRKYLIRSVNNCIELYNYSQDVGNWGLGGNAAVGRDPLE